jgi:hypothetical protein
MKTYRIYGVGSLIDVEACSSEHAEMLAVEQHPEMTVDRMVTRRIDE